MNKFDEYLNLMNEGKPRYEIIAFLVKANNGFMIGTHSHKILTTRQIIDLSSWQAFFDGITMFSGIDAYKTFKPYYCKYLGVPFDENVPYNVGGKPKRE